MTDIAYKIATLTMAETGRVILQYDYDRFNPADIQFKDDLKRIIEGLYWEPKNKRWTVHVNQLPAVVKAFGGKEHVFASQDVKDAYAAVRARHLELDAIRKKVHSDLVVPTLLPLRNFQLTGIEFIIAAGGRALVADQPGLGKTSLSIGYAVYHNHLKTLIICPKSVVINWQREILRFAGHEACMWNAKGSVGDINTRYHVVNYDVLDKLHTTFNTMQFELLVCDEATYLKNHKAKRTKAIMGNWKERSTYPGIKTPHVIFLTGTPVLNKPLEAFQLLHFISKDRFGNVMHFINRYGAPGEPPRNLTDLHHRTKDIVIRRLKKDVLGEMPEKTHDDIIIELPKAAFKQYEEVMRSVIGEWANAGRPSAAQMPKVQQALLPYKLERAYEFIDEMLENGESVLVFSQYRQPVLDIKARYGDNCGVIMGGTSNTARQKTIDNLRHKRVQVGAMTMQAAGMGIDGIQYGVSTVLFLDRFWFPAVHEQAEDRVHRSGQTESVQVYYLTCKDTIDEDMALLLSEKQRIIDQVVEGGIVEKARSQSIFKDFITRLKARKYGHLINADVVDDTDNNISEDL